MNTLIDTLKYFLFITAELIILFVLINAIVEFILMHLSENKMQRYLSGKGLWGNIIAAGFGALTPFCACSTIPMTVGLLKAKVPFGATMSFLISSPLLNPIIIGMLAVLVGFKSAIVYFILAFLSSVIFGFVLEKTGAQKYIKSIHTKPCCCSAEPSKIKTLALKDKIRISFKNAFDTLRPVLIYLLIGVAIGAVIYGYMPKDLVLKIAGTDNLFAVPVAAVVGIPLYIRVETAIPIGVALMDKGMSIGAVVALIIGGAGMAIPEMSMLAAVFKLKLVSAIVAVIFLTAVICGFVFNLLF